MGKSYYNRYKEYKDLSTEFNTIKSPVISAILNCNMRIFTISSLIVVIFAIEMIAKATGQQTGCVMCEQWFEKIEKCNVGNAENEAGLITCCRNQGIPYECSGYCTLKEIENMLMWKCGNWFQQMRKCSGVNDGYVCCEEQGVPKECSAYCETS